MCVWGVCSQASLDFRGSPVRGAWLVASFQARRRITPTSPLASLLRSGFEQPALSGSVAEASGQRHSQSQPGLGVPHQRCPCQDMALPLGQVRW